MKQQTVRVDLVADFVCPWCWLGWRHWQAAKRLVPDIRTDVTWRPHELDPTIPEDGRRGKGDESDTRWGTRSSPAPLPQTAPT